MDRLLSDGQVLDLVEHIYSAGSNPSEWKTFASRLHALVPSTTFTLYLSIEGTGLAESCSSSGIPYEFMRSYFEHYQFLNPYRQLFAKMPVGKVQTLGGLVDRDRVKELAFYHEWLRPAGRLTHGAGLVIARDDERLMRLSLDIPEPHGHIEEPAADLLGRLAPHLLRAFKVNEHFAASIVSHQALSAMIENLDGPAGIVASDGRIVLLNTAAEAMARDGGLIRCGADNRLTFHYSSYEERFKRALANACDAARSDGLTGFTAVGLDCVPRHVVVLPLRPARGTAVPSRPLALVAIREPAASARPAAKILQSMFGLTPSEAAVAIDLASGLTTEAMAEKHAVSRLTVRNQLAAAMSKMGVRRQAELVIKIVTIAPQLKLDGRDEG